MKVNAQTLPQQHRISLPRVTKKTSKTERYWMINSNNNNYMFKCYLKFFKIVSDEMRSFKGSYAFKLIL